MAKFYLTTAIDYPNSRPHIGTAFEKLGADVQARYRRFRGDDVFFLMGNDENTAKVLRQARKLGEEPKAYVDFMAGRFKRTWQALGISYDDFIQTTEERHRVGVQAFLQAVNRGGFIYKKKYQGLYCEGCEAFKTTKDLSGERCPEHPDAELKLLQEENYFFALSRFRDRLLNSFRHGDLRIEPESRRNEVVAAVEADLQDISISRPNTGWGIPIPWDETQVTYVWFDALLNYLTGVGFGTDWERFHRWWPADVHFIGKDITRFHCALFPAMIMAYNANPIREAIDRPPLVFAHGFIMERKGGDLVKSSKSAGGLDPEQLAYRFGADAYRYYFLSKCDYGSDGEYDYGHFVEVYNADLANNLGNLVSRTAAMILKYFNGSLHNGGNPNLGPYFAEKVKRYEAATEQCRYREALEVAWEILRFANAYIDKEKPWEQAKNNPPQCGWTLRQTATMLRVVALMLRPYLPVTAEKIYRCFTFNVEWEEATWETLVRLTGNDESLYHGIGVNPRALTGSGQVAPLFPRIEPTDAKPGGPIFSQD